MKSSIVHNSFFIYERFIYEPLIMNSFYERFFVHRFCYVLPLLRLRGAQHDACWAQWLSLRDSKYSDLLAQWMSSSPLIRARCTEAMDHAPLPVVHKTKTQAIRTYAEALFSAPFPIGLLLEFGAPLSDFRVLSEYVARQGDAYTARTGLPFPWPIPTRDQFDARWKSLTAPLALSPLVEFAGPPSSGRCWPLQSCAQYLQSRPVLCQSIDWTRPLTLVVRDDGYPCATGSWS